MDYYKEQEKGKSGKYIVLAGILVSVLIIIFVVVVCCILILKLMPDSIGAYYISDVIESIQVRLGLAG